MVDSNNMKITVTMMQKMDSLLAKHGVKLAGSWTDFPAHVIYNIYETPNMEALVQATMEPEMMAWLRFNSAETKLVMSLPEVKAMLKIK